MTDTPEWNEESIDERVRALATAGYHRPEGMVPRDAMWAAIAPAWRAAQASTPDIAPRRTTRVTSWRWAGALAAGLLIGVVLDRGVQSYRASTRVTSDSEPAARVASSTTPTVAAPAVVTPSAGSTEAAATIPSESAPTRATTKPRDAAIAEAQDSPARAPRGVRSLDPARTLYHAAAVQTLVQAEALLTTYRRADDASRDTASIRQAARWARDVLSSTRLLLDSPAARDAQLRSLLTDLELVLAQIVQLSGAPLQAGERELIERAMRDRDLLLRLRSAVPAGAATS
jgi:hypothetical protein